MNKNNELALVGQWRYIHNKYSWEVPTGSADPQDKKMINAAKRELEEEVGVIAKEWISLGTNDNSNGATSDVAHLYLATKLESGKIKFDPTEKIKVKWVDFRKAVKMVMGGKITESNSVAAILKADKLLNQ